MLQYDYIISIHFLKEMGKLTDDEKLYQVFDLVNNLIRFKGNGAFASLMERKSFMYVLSIENGNVYMRFARKLVGDYDQWDLEMDDKWNINSKAGTN